MSGPSGSVLVFAEPDYCYGVGPLTLRVEKIDWSRPVWYDDENWYQVVGVEVDPSGRDRGRRQVLVRARKLPTEPPPG